MTDARIKELERLLEEAVRRREEERRRREDAEHDIGQLLNQQGITANPTRSLVPTQIIPWDDFREKQDTLWKRVMGCNDFCSALLFPSHQQLDYVRKNLYLFGSEDEPRAFVRSTVDDALVRLIKEASKDSFAKVELGLNGTIAFQSYTNLGKEESWSESTEIKTPEAKRVHRQAKGKGNRADQFCIYHTAGQAFPIIAVEFKPPHKLSKEEIILGLQSLIHTEDDVINHDGQGPEFDSKCLVAAIVTQLFSYIIGNSVRYGYVCTGEAFVFLHIPDDPSTVHYKVCVSKEDIVQDEIILDKDILRYTAVGQVFTFILQSLSTKPPPAAWHDKANELKTWMVEYDDVLQKIPPSSRKQIRESESSSLYKPRQQKGYVHSSSIQTHSSCKPQQDDHTNKDDDHREDSDLNAMRNPDSHPSQESFSTSASSLPKQAQHGSGNTGSNTTKQTIEDRRFCTQTCLLGLAQGGPVHNDCPNSAEHGKKHINCSEFLSLLHKQLAQDRGPDADCVPLYKRGSRGVMYKVRLSSHGYTLVAKGMKKRHLNRLNHESDCYDLLQDVQGKHVPVCLGTIDLALPYYYLGDKYWHFLLLSWAGQPLFDCISQIDKAQILDKVMAAFAELHKRQIVHHDAELRNILYDATHGTLMVVDFERAEPQSRGTLAASSGNRSRHLKKKKKASDPFAEELQSVVAVVSKYFG